MGAALGAEIGFYRGVAVALLPTAKGRAAATAAATLTLADAAIAAGPVHSDIAERLERLRAKMTALRAQLGLDAAALRWNPDAAAAAPASCASRDVGGGDVSF